MCVHCRATGLCCRLANPAIGPTDDPAFQRRHQHPAGAIALRHHPGRHGGRRRAAGEIRAGLDRQAPRHAGRVRQRRHRARRRHAVRLDARRRHGAQRRRRLQMDLGQRGPGASRVLVVPRRQAAGPRRGVRRRVAGASLCQRGQGQILARAEGVPRRQDGQAMDLPAAAAHRPYQGHRARRRPAVGRRRDRLAAGIEGLRPKLHRAAGRSRSAGMRHPSHPGASGAARIASSSPTASSA